MISSPSTFFAPPPFLSSSPPSRTSRISPALSAATAASSSRYTSCADDPPRLRQVPRRSSATASLYEILEIPVGSTSREIKSAYRRLARICHPDVAGNGRSADEFVRIHAAYCTLSDPEKRAVYDRQRILLLRRSRPLRGGVSGFGGYGGGNWETDQCW